VTATGPELAGPAIGELGSVHPIEPVTLTARTRQFFAQVETLVMFGFPRQDSTFLGRAFRTFFLLRLSSLLSITSSAGRH
jgi:hypothetical protein